MALFNSKKNRDFSQVKTETFNFELIADYFIKNQHPKEVVNNDRTCNDLDFDEFFIWADRTVSRPGQQFLYNHLRINHQNYDHHSEQEHFLKEQKGKLDQIRNLLNRLSDVEAYYINTLFQDEHIKKPKWFFVIPLLAFTTFCLLALIPFQLKLLIPFTFISVINLIIHYWNKRNLFQYVSALPQLLKLSNVANSLLKIGCKDESKSIKAANTVVGKLKGQMRFFQLEAKIDSDFTSIFWGLIELIKILLLAEPLLLFSALKKIDTHRTDIHLLFRFVARIDMYQSIAALRENLPFYSIPEITSENKRMKMNQVYHPLIENSTANSLDIKESSILLTGSNMSGKTTFIRTIGLNVLSAYALNTCFAKSFSLPSLRIFSCIRISDDLLNDRSYYLEEVITIKGLLDESSNSNCLFLLDELYKGTNTIERIAAGKAVLDALHKMSNIVIAATHDLELCDLLDDTFELYHFCERIVNNNVDFDYLLKKGPLLHTNAINILTLNQYPTEVINEARSLVNERAT